MTSNISYRCSTDTTYWSVITLSVWVEFEFFFLPHLYRSVITLSVWVEFEFFWDCTYINRSSSYQFEFELSGLHLYQSIIFLSVWVWVFGTAPISIGHHLVNLSWVWVFFLDRTYINRSFIFHVSLSSVKVFVPC